MKVENEKLDYVNLKFEKRDDNDETRAIIARFPSVIPAKNAITSSFKYFKSSSTLNKTKAMQRKLVANTDAKINYEGFLKDASTTSHFKNYVGVYNKKKNKLVLYDAHLINMHLQSDDKNIELKEKLENKERNDMLIQAFGSVKGKRGIETKKRNYEFKKSVSSTIGYAFEHVDKETLEVADSSLDNPILEYLPQFYPSATDPQDVFPWSSLITEQEMDALTGCSSDFVESTHEVIRDWSEKATYSGFILKRLSYLPSEEGERLRKCNFLILIHFLFCLFKLKARDFKKRNFLPLEVPPLLKAGLLDRFTSPVADHKFARNMSSKQRDRLLYHTLVACLKFDDCDIVVSELKEDLRARDLVKYYKMMGCKLLPSKLPDGKVAKDNPRAVLEVPYVLPDPPRPKVEKRKRE